MADPSYSKGRKQQKSQAGLHPSTISRGAQATRSGPSNEAQTEKGLLTLKLAAAVAAAPALVLAAAVVAEARAVAAAPALVLAAAVVAEARAVAAAPALVLAATVVAEARASPAPAPALLVLAAAVLAKVRAEATPALPTAPAIEAEVNTAATAEVAEVQPATRGVDAMIEAVIGTKDPPLEIRRVS